MQIFQELGIASEVRNLAERLDKSVMIADDKVVQTINFHHGDLEHEKNLSLSQVKLEKIMSNNISYKDTSYIKTLYNRLLYKKVLYGHQFINYHEDIPNGLTAAIYDTQHNQLKSVRSKVIVAADGAKSSIRNKLQITFEGRTTPELSFSFDAKLLTSLAPNQMYIYSNNNGRAILVPMEEKKYKIFGKWMNYRHDTADKETLALIVLERSGIELDKDSISGLVNYHTSSRMASSFHKNNIFLIGDAAHVFYPAGGYGLNLAIKEGFLLGRAITEFIRTGNKEQVNQVLTNAKSEATRIQEDAEQRQLASTKLSNAVAHQHIEEEQKYTKISF